MKVYLAGKIGKNDWRTEIVGGHAGLDDAALAEGWPTLVGAVLGRHDYVGPYFVACDHGCAHGRDTHGVSNDRVGCGAESRNPRGLVVERCLLAVERANLVFAWVDSVTAYGTLFELGYARALKKPIVVAHPRGFYDASDLWFARAASTTLIVDAESPREALERALGDAAPEAVGTIIEMERLAKWRVASEAKCESPIEKKMLDALAPYFPCLTDRRDELAATGPSGTLLQQHGVTIDSARMRLDFAVLGPAKLVAVECDGFDYHDRTPEQATRDKARDRLLRRAGWEVVRYTGQELHRDAAKCAAEIVSLASTKEAG